MTPEELKALRKELACTAKDLATALDVDQATVLAWEASQLFPTKQYVDKMEALRAKGPSAIPRKTRGPSPMAAMTDPGLWQIFRKLVAHKKLRDDVLEMAKKYPDPADEK